jgi:hypothetical protein
VTGDRTSCWDSPRRDSAGGVAPFEDGDDEFERILTDLATAVRAAEDGWDRGLRDAGDKDEAEKFPR